MSKAFLLRDGDGDDEKTAVSRRGSAPSTRPEAPYAPPVVAHCFATRRQAEKLNPIVLRAQELLDKDTQFSNVKVMLSDSWWRPIGVVGLHVMLRANSGKTLMENVRALLAPLAVEFGIPLHVEEMPDWDKMKFSTMESVLYESPFTWRGWWNELRWRVW